MRENVLANQVVVKFKSRKNLEVTLDGESATEKKNHTEGGATV